MPMFLQADELSIFGIGFWAVRPRLVLAFSQSFAFGGCAFSMQGCCIEKLNPTSFDRTLVFYLLW